MKKPNNIRKARQAVKLLIAKPKFQEEVLKLRHKWELDGESKEENGNRLQVDALWGGKLKGMTPQALRGNKDALERYKKARAFYTDLIGLMRKFGLDSQYWLMTLWEYVRIGRFDEEALKLNLEHLDTIPRVRFVVQPKTGKKKIIIELGDESTVNDVKGIWHEVEWWRKRLSPNRRKFKEWKNFERDARINELYEEGKTVAEICNLIETEFRNQKDLGYSNIRKVISTFRKSFGLPKGSKLLTRRPNPRPKSYKDYFR